MSKNKINMGGLNAMFGDQETEVAPKPTTEKKPPVKKTTTTKPRVSPEKKVSSKQIDYEGNRVTYTLSNEVLMAIRMEYAETGKNQSKIVNEILEKHFKIKR